MMDEMQPVVLENKEFDSQEKKIQFLTFFGPPSLQCEKIVPKKLLKDAF